MKVGIYSPYFDTMGGGERYALTVAEFFLKRKDQVTIFDGGKLDKKSVKQRFDLNVNEAFTKNGLSTFGYDLFFFVSDGSIPFSLAKRNILHFQVPFKFYNGQNILNKLKFSRFSHVVCNSNFTKKSIDETFGITSEVLYPPVDVENFKPGKKENIILGVGRFFAPMHPKKQEEMIQAFIKMKSDWQLVLIGGVTGEESIESVKQLKKIAKGYNIKIITDSTLDVLKDYYSRAKLFWHAAGFGEDLKRYPEKAEHFGMSTVEAMAAGCVPIVFAGGGQIEIVNEKNGFLWKTIDELESKTQQLILDNILMGKLSKQAILDAKNFSKEKFFQNLNEII